MADEEQLVTEYETAAKQRNVARQAVADEVQRQATAGIHAATIAQQSGLSFQQNPARAHGRRSRVPLIFSGST